MTAKPSPKRSRKLGRPFANQSVESDILAGAATAFAAKGFADTTVEDICKAAKVARSTYYRFYNDKEAVFTILLDTATVALVETVRSAIRSEQDTQAKLEAAIGAYLRAQAFAGPLARVLVHAATGPNPVGAARREKSIQEFIAIFRDGIGEDAPEDPLVYRGLLAALESVSLQLMDAGPMTEADIQRGMQVMKTLLTGTVDLKPKKQIRRR